MGLRSALRLPVERLFEPRVPALQSIEPVYRLRGLGECGSRLEFLSRLLSPEHIARLFQLFAAAPPQTCDPLRSIHANPRAAVWRETSSGYDAKRFLQDENSCLRCEVSIDSASLYSLQMFEPLRLSCSTRRLLLLVTLYLLDLALQFLRPGSSGKEDRFLLTRSSAPANLALASRVLPVIAA